MEWGRFFAVAPPARPRPHEGTRSDKLLLSRSRTVREEAEKKKSWRTVGRGVCEFVRAAVTGLVGGGGQHGVLPPSPEVFLLLEREGAHLRSWSSLQHHEAPLHRQGTSWALAPVGALRSVGLFTPVS